MKEENKQIVFTGSLSLDDAHKFTRYQLIIKHKYPLIYLSAVAFSMSTVLYYAFKGETTSQKMAIILTAATVTMGLIWGLTVLYFLIKKRTATFYKLDPAISKEAVYIANDHGIKIEMINEVVRWYEWKDLLNSYEFKDMFLIYVNSISVIYIPKSFFKTQEDINEFSTLLLQKTKKIDK
ncbi:YcxB family protein [Marinilactibacillus psychrotolerans]|uniref:YcxB family protein n=1 Tax=Marinilactibacillus psychrotolerans TaxID=191770 RepID=UPI003885DB11